MNGNELTIVSFGRSDTPETTFSFLLAATGPVNLDYHLSWKAFAEQRRISSEEKVSSVMCWIAMVSICCSALTCLSKRFLPFPLLIAPWRFPLIVSRPSIPLLPNGSCAIHDIGPANSLQRMMLMPQPVNRKMDAQQLLACRGWVGGSL